VSTAAGFSFLRLDPGSLSLDLTTFDCGVEDYNQWLAVSAASAVRSGTAAVHLLVRDGDAERSPRVLGYIAIAPTAVARDDLPGAVARGMPRMIPGYLLAKMALDTSLRGDRRMRWGTQLVVEALRRIVEAATAGGGRVIVVDPGMVPDRSAILDPLAALGLTPDDVTDIVLSHHHPDHTVNIAMFPVVPVHDVQAVYEGDVWTSREAEGVLLTPSVRLLATPGHTPQDLTVLVGTADGVAALTHLWWTADGPAEDPYAPDREVLRQQRERVLALCDLVVPGHGPSFVPGEATPR